jgi:glutathione S-transferase
MKIYSGPLSMFGAKVEIAAREKGIDFELEMVPFSMRTLYEPKHPEVLRINPRRQVPVLIDGTLEVFDSTQIFEYFEDGWPAPALWPATPQDRARARLLELKSDEVFFPHVIRLMGLRGQGAHPDAGPARAAIGSYYDDMNRMLADRDHLAGPYSYADIAFFMAQFFAARMGVPMPSALPHLAGWRVRVSQRPAVQHVIGAMEEFLRRSGMPLPVYA